MIDLNDLIEKLQEKIKYTINELREASEDDMNSFGAGYESGYLEALNHTLNTINEEEEDVL